MSKPLRGLRGMRWVSRSRGWDAITVNMHATFGQSAKEFGVEALITDDYLLVEKTIEALQPEMILGTQMERHIGKRLGIPCAVISAPVHVQDFPARYSPQMGFEGANVIFDTWIHPLVMGLEEHLLHMFREDFEFNDAAGPAIMVGTNPQGSPRTQFEGSDGRAVCCSKRRRRCGYMVGGSGKRVEKNTFFCAGQGPPQHRDLCNLARLVGNFC